MSWTLAWATPPRYLATAACGPIPMKRVSRRGFRRGSEPCRTSSRSRASPVRRYRPRAACASARRSAWQTARSGSSGSRPRAACGRPRAGSLPRQKGEPEQDPDAAEEDEDDATNAHWNRRNSAARPRAALHAATDVVATGQPTAKMTPRLTHHHARRQGGTASGLWADRLSGTNRRRRRRSPGAGSSATSTTAYSSDSQHLGSICKHHPPPTWRHLFSSPAKPALQATPPELPDRQEEGPVSRAFSVAGAGFEPATSGLCAASIVIIAEGAVRRVLVRTADPRLGLRPPTSTAARNDAHHRERRAGMARYIPSSTGTPSRRRYVCTGSGIRCSLWAS